MFESEKMFEAIYIYNYIYNILSQLYPHDIPIVSQLPWQVANNIGNFQKRLDMLLSLTDAGSPKSMKLPVGLPTKITRSGKLS